MATELELEENKVNCSPGFTKTNLNNYASMGTFEDSTEAGRIALLTPDGSTETFTHARLGQLPW